MISLTIQRLKLYTPPDSVTAGAGWAGDIWRWCEHSADFAGINFYYVDSARLTRVAKSIPLGIIFEGSHFSVEYLALMSSMRMSTEVVTQQYRRFAILDPDERPFAHPFYWAAFTIIGD